MVAQVMREVGVGRSEIVSGYQVPIEMAETGPCEISLYKGMQLVKEHSRDSSRGSLAWTGQQGTSMRKGGGEPDGDAS